ncbi:MAG TPA: flagella basal body P-ring formation protein FlgA [Spirochaetia bacterium]|nr:flagella basal body P-ring formation protein FlgA [Spirochaetia bacterium]
MTRRARYGVMALLGFAAALWADAAGGSPDPASPAGGPLTLYVTRVVRLAPGDVSLGRLLVVSGNLSAQASQTLDLVVARLGAQPMVVPARSYQSLVESGMGPDAIVVGTRTVLVPTGSVPQGEDYLLDRLADYLAGQGMLPDTPTELTVEQNQLRGLAPQSGSPVFQLQTSRGVTEVSFDLQGPGFASVTGRIRLGGSAAGGSPDASYAGASDGVRAGDPVAVLFRKNLITIEMPGRAQGTARIGDSVTVYVPESMRAFSGEVTGGKAVTVDLP